MWSAQRRSLTLPPRSTPTPPPFRKLVFFACFRFLIFHLFFQGGQLTPSAHAHGCCPWWVSFSIRRGDKAVDPNEYPTESLLPLDLYSMCKHGFIHKTGST